MLKVECESCKAPYQVDERRVPPTGLKMRCPKCGHTFKVTNPNAPAAAAAPPAPKAAAPAATVKHAPAAPVSSPAPISGRRAPTMVGGIAANIPGLPDIGDDPLGELPAPKAGPIVPKFGGSPSKTQPAPAAPGPAVPQAAPRAPRAPTPGAFGSPGEGSFGALDDLPSPAGDAGLPAFAGGGRKGAPPFGGPPPKPAAPPANAGGDFDFDMGGMPGAGGFGSLDDDLPVAAAPGLPAMRQGGGGGGGFGNVDLPAARSPGFGADLPAPRAPGFGADLPSPRAPGFGADLPSPRAPSMSAGPLAASGPPAGFGEIDLPAVGSALPALPNNNRDLPSPLDPSKMMPARAKEFSPFDDLPRAQSNDYQLPVVQSALPALQASLPSVQSSLPSVQSSLPSVQSSLPSLQNSLPSIQGSLPSVQSSLPSVQGSLPSLLDSLPSAQNSLPAAKNFDSFGEFELPGGGGGGGSIPPGLGGDDEGAMGGVGFGEVDLGGGMMDDDAEPIGTEEPIGGAHNSVPGMPGIGTEVSLRGDDKVRRRANTVVIRKKSKGPKIMLGLVFAAAAAGAALQATPYGAFGYQIVADKMHAKDYDALTQSAGASARKRTGQDTWSEFRGAIDDLAAAHASSPRAKAITAYAAIVAYEQELRYGNDGQSDSRAKAWLAELSGQKSKYTDVAQAASDAIGGDTGKAASELDAAARVDVQDPLQQDIALMRGDVALIAKDNAAAMTAFKHAAELAPSARAQYGLARAAVASGDSKTARTAANAALALNKLHAGALLLRSRLEWKEDHADDAALADLALVLDGPGAAAASPQELSDAHALRGWIQLSHDRSADARAQFDEAVKLNARNVVALNGQGELLLAEQRATEAKARFDTALGADPTDIDAIVGDGKAKIALEDLESAKKDLTAARAKFPKSWKIAHTLGKVEEALGNKKDAEADYQAAIDLIDTTDSHALTPYVSLAELLALEGKADLAQAKLEEAKDKLPDSALMQRAFGDVAAAQGKFDDALARYSQALQKDPTDPRTHFRLAIAYRKMGRMDDSAKEFDSVATADKDFPNLALERGLLYEETGHVDQALAMFSGALAKAPNDPDLTLRVGAAYISIGKWDKGMPMVKKVLDARPNSAEANFYYGRGFMLQGKGEQPKAGLFLQKAIDLDPNRAEYHLYMAWEANEQNALNQVDTELKKAMAIDASLADAYWQRGVLERKRTRIDDAIVDLKKALELKPSRFEAHATLAECYEEKTDDNTAFAEWQKAIAGDDQNGFWRYRYARLRSVHGQGASAVGDLAIAVQQGQNDTSGNSGWLYDAEFLYAEALRATGKNDDAVTHYNAFLKLAPAQSADVGAAKKALQLLGHPFVQE